MELQWYEYLIYGFVSGLSELLPVSSQAHQAVLRKLLGMSASLPVLHLLIHVGALLGLYAAVREHLQVLLRQLRYAAIPPRRRRRQPDLRSLLDVKLIRSAFWMLLLGFLFLPVTKGLENQLHIVAAVLVLNSVILLLPQILPSGNKDSRSMTRLDGALLGLGSALSVVPGISAMATSTTVTLSRGADRQNALNWALMIMLPALAFWIGFDIYDMITIGAGISGFVSVLLSLLSAACAYCGAYLAVVFLRFLSVNTGFHHFGYYSLGVALFAFILYLTI